MGTGAEQQYEEPRKNNDHTYEAADNGLKMLATIEKLATASLQAAEEPLGRWHRERTNTDQAQ